MNFDEFINQYDFEGSIVLLEGKRNVLENDIDKLISLGNKIAIQSKYIKVRSGNADGSDYYFCKGFAEFAKDRLEVIVPAKNHRAKYNMANETYNIGNMNFVNEDEVIYQTKNKKTEAMIDSYLKGEKNRYSVKAPYLIRDTMKVIGHNEIKACDFAIFYDDLDNPKQGGTGHTINVCEKNNVPHVNQSVWFNWL